MNHRYYRPLAGSAQLREQVSEENKYRTRPVGISLSALLDAKLGNTGHVRYQQSQQAGLDFAPYLTQNSHGFA